MARPPHGRRRLRRGSPVGPTLSDDPDLSLTAALEIALLRELQAAWRQLNDSYFRGALVAPTIQLGGARVKLGSWMPQTRTLEISRGLVAREPWGTVVEVLKHEMAHQYVYEVLGETTQTPHGKGFRDTCARLGIDGRAAGMPAAQVWVGGAPPPPQVSAANDSNAALGASVVDARAEEDRIAHRVSKLLALAESPNRHEAEAAMAAAQRLMLKHNLRSVRSHRERHYVFAHLGQPSGRVSEHERLVAMILGKHFFVETIWVPAYRALEGKRGSVLEICGTRANVAIAEYVHGFLHETAARLWHEHKRQNRIAYDRERRVYLAGVMSGFADKLAQQSARSRSEGLVWVRDGDLEAYLRRRHPHIHHVRHGGHRRTETWVRGLEAGRSIVLNRPIEAPAESRGRLLPRRSS